MTDAVIKLIQVTKYDNDEYGNEIRTTTDKTVFCRVESVTRSEFYSAAQNNLHPSYVFILSNYRDYEGETELKYEDWTGAEKIYSVVRVYRNGDSVELTAEERIGNG